MAAGDGAATLVGRRSRGARIPWNRDKSVAGSVAFVIAGSAAGLFLAWWCRPAVMPPPYEWFSLVAPIVGAVAAAAVETVPIKLDDNLSVPSTAAIAMWSMSLVSEDLAAAATHAAVRVMPLALLANLAVAGLGYAARTVSISGAVCGAAIGILIFVFGGWQAWMLLLAAFAFASITSRMGLRRKTLLGIAEARAGRRGAGNAIANTGIAAAAAVLSALTYAHDAALVAFAAALTAGASDTVASEIGKAWGQDDLVDRTVAPRHAWHVRGDLARRDRCWLNRRLRARRHRRGARDRAAHGARPHRRRGHCRFVRRKRPRRDARRTRNPEQRRR